MKKNIESFNYCIANSGNIITSFNFTVKFLTKIIILKNTNKLEINLTIMN